LFGYGTALAMHQYRAYVVMRSRMLFAGCWVALEDVAYGSGELQYYVGSHMIPVFFWFGRARARPPGYDDDGEFLEWVDEQSVRAGCEKVTFRPKKGDALIWHADLVHGGSPRVHRELTRWSLVSHYCPVDVDPAWMRDARSSRRREHVPGAFYCNLPL
jgi:ectoine hydroxylase-related dioxygenase (phytanoyl-CoA dioxygenase family)